jgi:hypothetical protein
VYRCMGSEARRTFMIALENGELYTNSGSSSHFVEIKYFTYLVRRPIIINHSRTPWHARADSPQNGVPLCALQ